MPVSLPVIPPSVSSTHLHTTAGNIHFISPFTTWLIPHHQCVSPVHALSVLLLPALLPGKSFTTALPFLVHILSCIQKGADCYFLRALRHRWWSFPFNVLLFTPSYWSCIHHSSNFSFYSLILCGEDCTNRLSTHISHFKLYIRQCTIMIVFVFQGSLSIFSYASFFRGSNVSLYIYKLQESGLSSIHLIHWVYALELYCR